jgi:predicted transcriptional regulator of viral defense system
MPDLLNSEEFVIFTTREYATQNRVSMPAASHKLARFSKKGLLTRITKGIWSNTKHPYFHPLSCVPYLLAKEQGYVSFLTALHLHSVVSQIPRSIQIATTGRGRVVDSPVGRFEFFQIKPELMTQGAQWSDSRLPYLIATPEKALLDTLYLSTRKNRRFARLPELDLDTSGFRLREFKRLLQQLPIPRRVLSAISSRWADIQT